METAAPLADGVDHSSLLLQLRGYCSTDTVIWDCAVDSGMGKGKDVHSSGNLQREARNHAYSLMKNKF